MALIIAGSGPTDRDGNSAMFPGGNDSLKQLAEGLAAAGIAPIKPPGNDQAGSSNP